MSRPRYVPRFRRPAVEDAGRGPSDVRQLGPGRDGGRGPIRRARSGDRRDRKSSKPLRCSPTGSTPSATTSGIERANAATARSSPSTRSPCICSTTRSTICAMSESHSTPTSTQLTWGPLRRARRASRSTRRGRRNRPTRAPSPIRCDRCQRLAGLQLVAGRRVRRGGGRDLHAGFRELTPTATAPSRDIWPTSGYRRPARRDGAGRAADIGELVSEFGRRRPEKRAGTRSAGSIKRQPSQRSARSGWSPSSSPSGGCRSDVADTSPRRSSCSRCSASRGSVSSRCIRSTRCCTTGQYGVRIVAIVELGVLLTILATYWHPFARPDHRDASRRTSTDVDQIRACSRSRRRSSDAGRHEARPRPLPARRSSGGRKVQTGGSLAAGEPAQLLARRRPHAGRWPQAGRAVTAA